jgi:predicted dehydrogenase
MAAIRWGIVGCGDVTEIKSGPGFQKARGSELVAVMRRDGAKAQDYARRHGVAKWYDNADQLIADPHVDAVYVATPPGSHEVYAMKACAAGKPCYVEKPMARNTAEARRMVEAFASARLPLFVAYYRRGLPRFVKAREIIDGGKIGRIQSFSYRFADGQMKNRTEPVPWRLMAEHAGAGLFLDLGSHALDVLDFLLGPLKNVVGQSRNIGGQYDVEDDVSLSFDSPQGAVGVAAWNFVSARSEDEFIITGENGEIHFPCFAAGPLRLIGADGKQEEFDQPNPPHVAQPLIQMIVDDLLGVGEKKSPSTGVSALRTQEIMDRALENYYGGREDGFWKRQRPSRSS